MKINKDTLYRIINELKMAELKYLESGETKAVDAYEALEMLSALEDNELEVSE